METEIQNLKAVEERVNFLKMYGLRIDDIGTFSHIFVKAGFMKNSLLRKLNWYIEGVTSAICVTCLGRVEESFIVITGLNDDQSYVEAVLKFLNFEEFDFPQDLRSEPKVALEEVKNRILFREKEIQVLKEDLLKIKEKLEFVLEMDTDKLSPSIVVRTREMGLIFGWIPTDKADALRILVAEAVPKEKIRLQFDI
jgi:vacuolar-type H+-ATPase subunit I/STV1